MIVRDAGAGVAAAEALAAVLAVGLVPALFVAPPQAASTMVATRPSVAMVRCIRSSLFLDQPVGVDSVWTPLDETALEPCQGDLGGQRDQGEDEHRREDAVRVERRLRRRDDEPDRVDRAEVLADDGGDQGEAEARVEAREDAGEGGRQDHMRR